MEKRLSVPMRHGLRSCMEACFFIAGPYGRRPIRVIWVARQNAHAPHFAGIPICCGHGCGCHRLCHFFLSCQPSAATHPHTGARADFFVPKCFKDGGFQRQFLSEKRGSVRLKPADAMHQFLRQRHQILAFERSSFIANVLIKVTHEEGGLMQYVSGIFKHSPEIALFLSLALG